MDYETLPGLFASASIKYPDRPALCAKEGGYYKTVTYSQAQKKIDGFSRALFRLGVRFGERVAIVVPNGPYWVITDMAAMMLGAVDVPLYSSLTSEQVKEILIDSECRTIVLSGSDQFAKIRDIIAELPDMRTVITLEHPETGLPGITTISLDSAMSLGGQMGYAEEKEFVETTKRTKRSDLASIIYTSGTTGAPKGVALTHDNFLSNVEAIKRAINICDTDSHFSFLPLSHAFERMTGYYCMIASGAAIYYAQSMETITADMKDVKPTIGVSVPRLFEKIQAGITKKINAAPSFRQKLFHWGLEAGKLAYDPDNPGRNSASVRLRLFFAKLLVHKKIAAAFGGRLRFFVSGGAPLCMETAVFLRSLGIKVLEGYGLTETSPVISFNLLEDNRIGSVGKPLDNLEVKIADDGEILVKGPSITKGYFNNAQATSEVIDEKGWFHTGDIGRMDDGYIYITDRKKELLILSNGKNVAPQPLELKLRADEYISMAMVIGDKRNFVSALIVPDMDRLKNTVKKLGIEKSDIKELLKEPAVNSLMEDRVAKAMKGFARFEQVKKITLIPREFTQERGELTPTLKLKRRVIFKEFSGDIETMYAKKIC
ncbi:MAG: AMP-dependent synthetase [bacterium]|nr:MAG: AMP-dependent synthetase [bacterium]